MSKSIRKNPQLKTVVELSEYKGKQYLNIRDWYKRADGEYAPTPKGVAIPLELAEELPRMIKQVLAIKVEKKHKSKHKKSRKHDDEEE